jgi:hypothetical protein
LKELDATVKRVAFAEALIVPTPPRKSQ